MAAAATLDPDAHKRGESCRSSSISLRRGVTNERCGMDWSIIRSTAEELWERHRQQQRQLRLKVKEHTWEDGPATYPVPTQHHSGALTLDHMSKSCLKVYRSRAEEFRQRQRQRQRRLKELTREDRPATYPVPTQHHSRALTQDQVSMRCLKVEYQRRQRMKLKPVKHKYVITGQDPSLVCKVGNLSTREPQEQHDLSDYIDKHEDQRCDEDQQSIMEVEHGDMAAGDDERNRDPHTLARRGVEIEIPSQEQHYFIPSICFDMNQDSCIGNLVAQHKSSADSGKNGDADEPCSGSSNRDLIAQDTSSGGSSNRDLIAQDTSSGGSSNSVDVDELCNVSCDTNQQCILDIKHGPTAGKELEHLTLDQILRMTDCRYKDLLEPLPTWELKVVKILNMVRRRMITECNTKKLHVHTRFCEFNIAFFDHDKESEIKHETLFRKIHPSRYSLLDGSVNVVSIMVADVPINIYGTVLARDRNDYRCVYLFKRGRDNPQHMTKRKRMLALTGPYRALGGAVNMYFEFHLKMKGKEGQSQDKDFCKGLVELNAFNSIPGQSCTVSIESRLSTKSTVDMVFVPVWSALEAFLEVNLLNGKSYFTGQIFAWTLRNAQNETNLDEDLGEDVRTKIILYDGKMAGTETKVGGGGSVSLSRCVLAVPVNEKLVLKFSICENHKYKHIKFVLQPGDEDHTCKLGSYDIQVKIIWSGVFRQRSPRMWKLIGDHLVLW